MKIIGKEYSKSNIENVDRLADELVGKGAVPWINFLSFTDGASGFVSLAANATAGTPIGSSLCKFLPGEGINISFNNTTSVAGGEIAFSCELATDTNKGVASFSGDDFVVSSGQVDLIPIEVGHLKGSAVQLSSESFADNDTSLMTSAAISDLIGELAGLFPAGDISSVGFVTDSGTAAVATGAAGFRINGANGITVTATNTTSLVVSGDHDSLANFVAAEHIDWASSSAGTIHSSNYTDTTTNTQLSQEQVEDFAGALIASGGTKTGITVAYQDNTGDMDFVVATQTANDFTNTLKSKLDAIEASATADQTNAEIRTAVEAATDSNVFTNVDHARVNGSRVIQTLNCNFSDNIGTNEHFVPIVTTSESEAFTNVVTPLIVGAAGKLLKVFYRSNQHTHGSSNEVTVRLYTCPEGDNWTNANASVVGTQTANGVNRVNMFTADFSVVNDLDSGTNAFAAKDVIGISIQNSQAQNLTSKYLVTLVFEYNYSGY